VKKVWVLEGGRSARGVSGSRDVLVVRHVLVVRQTRCASTPLGQVLP